MSSSSDKDKSSTRAPSPWPPSTSLLEHIAYAGALDELSNAPPIRQHTASQGRSPSVYPRHRNDSDHEDRTRKPFLYLLYQSGMHGPQNGFRLLVGEAGICPADAGNALLARGEITRGTHELVHLKANGDVDVVPNVEDEEPGCGAVTSRIVDILTQSEAVAPVPLIEGAVSRKIRQEACYPRSVGKKPGPLSTAPLTGAGLLLRLAEEGSGRIRSVLLVKQDTSPKESEKFVLEMMKDRTEPCLAVCEAGRRWVYEGHTDAPAEACDRGFRLYSTSTAAPKTAATARMGPPPMVITARAPFESPVAVDLAAVVRVEVMRDGATKLEGTPVCETVEAAEVPLARMTEDVAEVVCVTLDELLISAEDAESVKVVSAGGLVSLLVACSLEDGAESVIDTTVVCETVVSVTEGEVVSVTTDVAVAVATAVMDSWRLTKAGELATGVASRTAETAKKRVEARIANVQTDRRECALKDEVWAGVLSKSEAVNECAGKRASGPLSGEPCLKRGVLKLEVGRLLSSWPSESKPRRDPSRSSPPRGPKIFAAAAI
ncbi:hypothetical protein K525DRAFT_243668 [Schizophyllum commune Loenen D]|nr:hypothetical protein K525DRAFT_243668 [Schizophyllum commune Loenen D]